MRESKNKFPQSSKCATYNIINAMEDHTGKISHIWENKLVPHKTDFPNASLFL